MRTYYDIHLNDQRIESQELYKEEIVMAGRYLITKKCLEHDVAQVDPLGPR